MGRLPRAVRDVLNHGLRGELIASAVGVELGAQLQSAITSDVSDGATPGDILQALRDACDQDPVAYARLLELIVLAGVDEPQRSSVHESGSGPGVIAVGEYRARLMRAASDSILSAIERTDVAEDRLTEVLACVAHVNHRFAAELVAMADGRQGERYVVGTQRLTPGGRRVDMEIATHRRLARTGLVWIEVKAGAIYQPNQLRDYAEQVKDPVHGEPDGRVLTIIPPNAVPMRDIASGPPRWVSKTWPEVALAADRLGREWGRAAGQPRWRDHAMHPAAPAQWRYLAELIRRLEQKGYARMQPLTPEDVIAAPRVVNLSRTIQDLVRAAREGIEGVTRHPDGGTRIKLSAPRGGCWQVFIPTEPKWFSERGRFGNAYPELLYWYEESWTPEQRGAPAFFAGITFNELASHTREALSNDDWHATLPEGVRVGGDGRLLRVGRTKYLSELIVTGTTLDEQGQALRTWADQAIKDVMALDQLPPRLEGANGADVV